MTTHFQPSVSVKRSLLRQRVVAGVTSVVLAAVMLAGMGSLMDGVRMREVPAYQPQFLLQAEGMITTCGGCSGIPVEWPVHRKPTPPSWMVRPLGLAPHSTSQTFIPVEGWDSSSPEIEFGDDECWSGVPPNAG